MADVLCPGCGGIFHETTDQFDPEKIAHGAMFRLKEPYRSWAWTSFPEHPDQVHAALECPSCGAPYADQTGKVTLAEQPRRKRGRPAQKSQG